MKQKHLINNAKLLALIAIMTLSLAGCSAWSGDDGNNSNNALRENLIQGSWRLEQAVYNSNVSNRTDLENVDSIQNCELDDRYLITYNGSSVNRLFLLTGGLKCSAGEQDTLVNLVWAFTPSKEQVVFTEDNDTANILTLSNNLLELSQVINYEFDDGVVEEATSTLRFVK